MKTFTLNIYADGRIVVRKQKTVWVVWMQQFQNGKWIDNEKTGEIYQHVLRYYAMAAALTFSLRIINSNHPGTRDLKI